MSFTPDSKTIKHLTLMKDKWNHGKLSLLRCHLIYAIDETFFMGSLDEKVDMLEADNLLHELFSDLKKLFPDIREHLSRPASSKISLEIQEEFEDDDAII